MELTEILNILDESKKEDVKLFLVTRFLKEGVKSSAKVLKKYDFKTLKVDVSKEIKEILFDYTYAILQKLVQKEYEVIDYSIITEDSKNVVYSFHLENKIFSFADVIDNQLIGGVNIPKLLDLSEINPDERLWSYCIELPCSNSKFYTFRKLAPSKVAKDSNNGQSRITAFFNTNNTQLELTSQTTLTFDKRIDCIYVGGSIYILNKGSFEGLVGLEEEFAEKAKTLVDNLEESNFIDGMDIIRERVNDSASLHKRMANIIKLGEYKNLNDNRIKKMLAYSKQHNLNLKITDGRIKIEDKHDVELLVKFLSDYFKDSQITGNSYGTFAGQLISQ